MGLTTAAGMNGPQNVVKKSQRDLTGRQYASDQEAKVADPASGAMPVDDRVDWLVGQVKTLTDMWNNNVPAMVSRITLLELQVEGRDKLLNILIDHALENGLDLSAYDIEGETDEIEPEAIEAVATPPRSRGRGSRTEVTDEQ